VRPEDIVVTENPVRHDGPEPAVLDVSYLGDHYQYRFAVGDIQLIALSSHRLGTGAINSTSARMWPRSSDNGPLHESTEHDLKRPRPGTR